MKLVRHRPTCTTSQQRKRGNLPPLRGLEDVARVQVAALLAPVSAARAWRRELQRGTAGRRAAAAMALVCRQGARAAVLVQHALLTDVSPWVRSQAAHALGLGAGKAASRALLQSHRLEAHPVVRAGVVTALGRQDVRQAEVLDAVTRSAQATEAQECAAALLALASWGVGADLVLGAALSHVDVRVRRAAAVLARQAGHAAALQQLGQDEDVTVARLAGA